MFDVATRETPERMVLAAKRNLTSYELGAFATELARRLGDGTVPALPGIDGAPFLVYYGEVDADSDGPVEWCRPVPADQAERIAGRFPDLALRADPAHREVYVRLTGSRYTVADWLRAMDSLQDWAAGNPLTDHTLGPVRQVFFADPTTAAPDTPVSDVVGPLFPVRR